MKKLMPFKHAAVLLPALALGISVASAEDQKCDCPCDSEQATVSVDKNHGRQDERRPANMSERARSARESQAARQSKAADEAHAQADAAASASHYLSSKPADDYFSSNLVGHEVMNRRDNKVIGTVNELLIEEDGQIGAVIISTGGLMGLGKKDLAVAWNKVERRIDGENVTLSIDVSDDSLVQAPSFARK